MQYFILFVLFFTFSFSKELINVNFKDLKLKELINITSQNINQNILVTGDIKGKVDFISNEAIEKKKLLTILKYSLEANGYSLIKNDNILRVVKKDALQKNNKEKKTVLKTKKTIKHIDKKINKIAKQNHTEVIFLKNMEVESLEKILNSIVSQRDYSKRIKPSIAIDKEFNSIILDGSFLEVQNLKNIISKLDILKAQVYVKAKIIELDNSSLEDIGLKFGILGGKIHSGGLYTFSSNLNGGDAIAIDTSSIGLQIPNVSSSLALGASLSLLNKTYALDVISEPSILCINNKQSLIYVGETVSIQTGSTTTDGGNTSNTFEREDIGLTLKVKPRVSDDNKVTLSINTILEGIKNTNTSSLNPDTTKKEIRTTAIVNNGESVILGGLIEKKNEKTIKKVPYMSDVPLIGELFKNRLNDTQNRNLLVIVTPYIIPKNKDLTYVRKELSKLKSLEDEFLEKVLLNLRAKKISTERKKDVSKNLTKEQKHKIEVKKVFGL